MRTESAEVSLPRRVDSPGPVSPRRALLVGVVAVLAAAALSVPISAALVRGELGVAAAVLPYLILVVGLWWATNGNLPVVVLAAYLIGPAPADNLLPQVLIFPADDFAVRARDLFFLADLVLLAAVALLAVTSRRTKPDTPPTAFGARWARWWCACLALLAAYPLVVGAWIGVGQSLPALLQGATMPLRAVAVVGLVLLWARRHGWDATVRDIARTVVGCGLVLAMAAVVVALAARIFAPDQTNISVLGYPLIADRRPALPGWGNNILSNYLCVCVATLLLLRRRMNWRLSAVVIATAALLLGLVFTEVRTAMLLSLLIVTVPVLAAVLRRLWPRRGAVPAIAGTAAVAVLLVVVAAVALPILNPRFQTLTPGVLAEQLPSASAVDQPPERSSFDAESGVDLGGESFSTRGGLVDAGLGVWSRNPVLGTGWNGWGWAKSEENPRLALAVDPHNGLLWLAADTGALGLLLLYALPVLLALRRPDLIWLWAIPAVATALELVNPNVRNGHFAVVVWAVIALLMVAPRAAPPTASPPSLSRQWFDTAGRASRWLRGIPPTSGVSTS